MKEVKEQKHFYAAMYLRLSKEDSDVGTTADPETQGEKMAYSEPRATVLAARGN